MTKRNSILSVITVLVLIIIGGALFFLGEKHAEETLSFKQVNPSQLADAMQQDHFYSDYKQNTLIINGKIASISKQDGKTLVRFATSTQYITYCEVDSSTQLPKVNNPVRLLAEGGSAKRQPDSVLLKSCIKL